MSRKEYFSKMLEIKYRQAKLALSQKLDVLYFNSKHRREKKKFNSLVSPEKQRQEFENAQTFAVELLDYLLGNLHVFDRLYITETQLELLRFLAVLRENSLVNQNPQLQMVGTIVRVTSSDNESILTLRFGNGKREDVFRTMQANPLAFIKANLLALVDFYTQWSVDQSIPLSAGMDGIRVISIKGELIVPSLSYVIFPDLGDPANLTAEQVKSVFSSISVNQHQVSVDQAGQRFFVKVTSEDAGDISEMNARYHYMGEFQGEENGQHYAVYGCNHKYTTFKDTQVSRSNLSVNNTNQQSARNST